MSILTKCQIEQKSAIIRKILLILTLRIVVFDSNSKILATGLIALFYVGEAYSLFELG